MCPICEYLRYTMFVNLINCGSFIENLSVKKLRTPSKAVLSSDCQISAVDDDSNLKHILNVISQNGVKKKSCSCHGVVVLLQASEQTVWSSKRYRNIAGICQKGEPEFRMLYCSSKKSGSKASVQW